MKHNKKSRIITWVSSLVGSLIVITILMTGCGSDPQSEEYQNPAIVTDNVQTVETDFSSRSYTPITVQVGIPVKWTIHMEQKDLNNCNGEFVISEFNISKGLMAGDNVVEFTPEETGTVPYSCWMGMIRSEIQVVDDLTKQ